MAIADLLIKLTDDIEDSYDVIEEKGGTLPEHKNTDSLPDAIRSIEGGGESDPEFGEVVLYGYTVSETVIDNISPSEFTVDVQDEERLKQAVDTTRYELPITVSVNGDDFSSSDSWTIEALDNAGQDVPELSDPMQFSEIFSLTADPMPSEAFSLNFVLESVGGVVIDERTTTKRALVSVAEFNKLAKSSGDFVLDDVPKLAVKEVKIGYSITTIPNYFLDGCEKVNVVSFSENSAVTTIGERFGRRIGRGYNSVNGVREIKIPEGVTSIAGNFLLQANVNGIITLPKTLTSIGNYFLFGAVVSCTIIIPQNVKTIGTYFLASSTIENPVYFVGVVNSVGGYFMSDCALNTSTVYINATPASAFATSNNTLSSPSTNLPSYKVGVPIKGVDSAAFVSKFANRTSNPYRKLIDRGAF